MKTMDNYPTHELGGILYRSGHVSPFGATILYENAINFSVFSKHATSCELVLYHRGEEEPFAVIPFSEEFRIGNVYSMIVYGLDYEELEYGYRFDGPIDPQGGHRFDYRKTLLDPYAKMVAGRERWGELPASGREFVHRGKVIPEDFDWETDKPLELPLRDLVIYEAHVRGLTMGAESGVKYKGSFAGLVEKIPYLKELGVNCVELLPIFEFDELENNRVVDGERLVNYWGYSTVDFFAPKAGYAASSMRGLASEELKNTIKQFHRSGIEVMLDVVFNHTAEGNEKGPCISFRGIDNKTYYLLTPEGYYYNFSGCGNTMNCNNAVVRNFILDCLRYWVSVYHIDGFRFDLASILSRDANGAPMSSPPVLESLAQDPVLGKTKLIAEAWDAGGLYQVGSFPAWGRWAEWNGKYRDCLRRFLKGEAECGPEMLMRIQGSPDLYANRNAEASINFVTCHDGFTLNDLVSYNDKHNEGNGEANCDGANDNNSWNCGVEGVTDDAEVNALRVRQIKNAVALLLLSRGVPMILAGDEFRNSQGGNNNAYCQDNAISWLDWGDLERNRSTFEFFKRMIELRKAHPVLRRAQFYSGVNSSGYPEVSFHGERAWVFDAMNPFHTFGFMFAETVADHGAEQDCFIYCGVNTYWEERTLELPIVPAGMQWRKVAYTFEEENYEEAAAESPIALMPRSLMVLVAKR
ncbi:MAG: glycogen debranching protein GlgX [Atopobiaceae bacterium]|nr:glycogen debranching protein GlgX [Atopobiaceae bacterium]MBR3313379.1 glycogen debranching protein GlgX [Atopobiaceae bacterium]